MKTYILNAENRKTLVNKIAELKGEKLRYTGVPRCAYEGGGLTVLKDGTLEADENADQALIATLLDEGLILPGTENEPLEDDTGTVETENTEEPSGLTLSFPRAGHTEASLQSLLNMMRTYGPLLSKATGGDFGGPDGMTGIRIEEDKITFTGFPDTVDADEIRAYTQLACAMNRYAKESMVRMRKLITESEKYTFRNWLLRMGMGTAEYKSDRRILMKNLSGHSAFRNKAEEEKWKASMKAKRDATRAKSTEE